MLYKWSRFSNIWSVKLFTFALKLQPYLSPAYLSLDTQQSLSKFSRCSTSPSNASHLYCERSKPIFHQIKDNPLLYPSSMGQDRLSDLALSSSH